jgi:hypothetical protein
VRSKSGCPEERTSFRARVNALEASDQLVRRENMTDKTLSAPTSYRAQKAW